MSSFCKQCSIDVFGEDFEDYSGFTKKEDTETGFLLDVICEGCGVTQVDHTGKCVSKLCLKKHG